MDMRELAYAARTCRRFVEERRLTRENLEWLVDCARVSPCARNAQVLRYIAAYTPECCAAVFPHTHWAGALKDWDGPAEGQRPTGYIAILVPRNTGKLAHMDVGIAARTIQLAATGKGWGCCMHASFDHGQCASILGAPETMDIDLLLALGVELEERRLAPMPSDGSFTYWRDEAGVHYVPKRALSEVLLAAL